MIENWTVVLGKVEMGKSDRKKAAVQRIIGNVHLNHRWSQSQNTINVELICIISLTSLITEIAQRYNFCLINGSCCRHFPA